MNYKELRQKESELQKTIVSLESSYNKNQTALVRLERELSDLDNQKKTELLRDRQAKLKALEDVETASLRKELEGLEQSRVKAQQQKMENINNLNVEDYRQAYSGQVLNIEKVMDSVSDVEEAGRRFLGDRLYESISLSMNESAVKLTTTDLDMIANRIKRLNTKLLKIDVSKALDWGEGIDKAFAKINPEKFDNSKFLAVYAILVIVAFFFASKFLFPILLVLFMALSGLNLFKAKDIMQSMRIAKALVENKNSIVETVENAIKEHMEDDKKAYEEEFAGIDAELVDRINAKQQDIENKIRLVDSTFKYDSTEIDKDFDVRRNNCESQVSSLKSELESELNRIKETGTELTQIRELLKDSVKDIVHTYTSMENKTQEAVFDGEFLVDVVNEEPVMFQHPKSSIVYTYKSLDSAINYMKLTLMESMVRMNMKLFKPYVFDIKRMGHYLSQFKHKDWDGYIAIASDTKSQEILLEELNIKLKERLGKILSGDIEEYNDAKIKSESVPESYLWVLVLDPDPAFLSREEVNQLLLNGARVGIYMNIILSEESVKEEGKKYVNLTNCVSSFAMIDDRGILPANLKALRRLCEASQKK